MIDTKVTLRLNVHGRAPVIVSDHATAAASVKGGESACMPGEVHPSFAAGVMSVTEEPAESIAAHVQLRADLTTQGGHIGYCPTCQPVACPGIGDTEAVADGRAMAVVRVGLPERTRNWILRVEQRSADPNLKIGVVEARGTTVTSLPDKPGTYILEKAASDEFFVHIRWDVATGKTSGWRKNQLQGGIAVTARLEPGPHLYSMERIPYFRAGSPTKFASVGALLMDGITHCTGTVVGPQTILTAAHCLEKYKDALENGRMSFILGHNAFEPVSTYAITGFAYPDGSAPGYEFTDDYDDDIGLIYVDRPFDVPTVPIHDGAPPWTAFADQALTFIGFGYNVVAGGRVGLGVKREAAWTVDAVHARTFEWSVSPRSTCVSDSGGPSLLVRETDALVVGVNSLGDQNCTMGRNTRVDAYVPWLETRIK